MDRIQLTTNLYLDEYIPRELYMLHQHKPHRLVGLLDSRLINSDQLLRTKFGQVTINNWWGLNDIDFAKEIAKPAGQRWIRNESGLRLHGTNTGAKLSQHFFGRASDKIFKNATSDEVRNYIKENYQILGITCIEDNVSWVHSDVRQLYNTKSLLIVYP